MPTLNLDLRSKVQKLQNIVLKQENLSDQINESNNTILQISNTPVLGEIQLCLNGSIMALGNSNDYTLDNRTITFNRTDIYIGDNILVFYLATN